MHIARRFVVRECFTRCISWMCGELGGMTISNTPFASPRATQIARALVATSVVLFVVGVVLYLPVILGSLAHGSVQMRAQFSLSLCVVAGLSMVGAAVLSYRNGRHTDGFAAVGIAGLYIALTGFLGGVAGETRRDDRLMQVQSAVIDGQKLVYVGGKIAPTLRSRMEEAIGGAERFTLCLDSWGGDAMAAADVAEAIASRQVTVIAAKCWSACVYLVAAADERMWLGPNEETGAVMVHDVSSPKSFAIVGRSRVDSMLKNIGMPPEFGRALHDIGVRPVCALSDVQMASVGMKGKSIELPEYTARCGKIGPSVPVQNWGVMRCS